MLKEPFSGNDTPRPESKYWPLATDFLHDSPKMEIPFRGIRSMEADDRMHEDPGGECTAEEDAGFWPGCRDSYRLTHDGLPSSSRTSCLPSSSASPLPNEMFSTGRSRGLRTKSTQKTRAQRTLASCSPHTASPAKLSVTRANSVYLLSGAGNSGVEAQAFHRVLRIGQGCGTTLVKLYCPTNQAEEAVELRGLIRSSIENTGSEFFTSQQ